MDLTQSLLIIFATIFLGIFCERRKIFSPIQIEGFESFLFKIALPCYLFTATLHYDFSTLICVPYIVSYLLSFAVIAAIIMLYYSSNIKTASLCMKIMAASYVNAAIYALPVITFLLGDPRAAILSNLIQVLVIQSCLITILSFITHKQKSMAQKLFVALSNPLVAMPMLGLLCNYLQLMPHIVISTMIQNLGNGASSIALFAFGLNLGGIEIRKENFSKDLLFIICLKNALHPIVAFFMGLYIFSLDKYWLHSLLIITSAPTAFVIYLIGKQFSVEVNFTKIAIAISSILSLIVLVLITFVII